MFENSLKVAIKISAFVIFILIFVFVCTLYKRKEMLLFSACFLMWSRQSKNQARRRINDNTVLCLLLVGLTKTGNISKKQAKRSLLSKSV